MARTRVDVTDREAPPFPAQSIELDCPPGDPRPGDLLPELLIGTGLPVREARSKVFGNWTWDYSDIPETLWQAARPIIAERVRALYARGVIRYGSW